MRSYPSPERPQESPLQGEKMVQSIKEPECDPCRFCRFLYDDSDESVGLYAYGCSFLDQASDEDAEWEPGCGRPCPGFKPIPVSEDLNHILC